MLRINQKNQHMWSSLLYAGLAVFSGAMVGVLVTRVASALMVFVLVAGLIAVAATIMRSEIGLLALVFTTYIRLSDVAVKFYGAPSIAQPFLGLLVLVLLIRWLLYGEKPTGWQRITILVGAYGLIGMASLLYATNYSRAFISWQEYVKDVIVAIIVVMLLQSVHSLRRTIWALLSAGIFMGSISVFQFITGTFTNTYWGFGQGELAQIITTTNDFRISGPLGDPNFYGQIIVVLVPLALDRLWNEPKRLLRLFAAWALIVCTLTAIFTFSRGTFVALLVVACLMLIRRPPNPIVLLITIMLAVPLFSILPSNYTDRIRTITDIIPGLGSEQQVQEEASFRGRASAQIVGLMMFADHPIIGVGLRNYGVHYQEYSRQLGLDPSSWDQSPHNLYLEVLTETGLIGLTAFLTIIGYLFYGLNQGRKDFIQAKLDDYANIAFAFGVAMIGYFFTAIFLHAARARYMWLLIGIGMAIPVVAKRELFARNKEDHGNF